MNKKKCKRGRGDEKGKDVTKEERGVSSLASATAPESTFHPSNIRVEQAGTSSLRFLVANYLRPGACTSFSRSFSRSLA